MHTICPRERVRFVAYFSRVKGLPDEDENEVNWPFVRTQYSEDIPDKLDLSEKAETNVILREIANEELTSILENYFIDFEFVNRPMRCRIRITGLHKEEDQSCDTKMLETLHEPICYYKVGGSEIPSLEELDEVYEKISSYTKRRKSGYTYISNINTFDGSNGNGDADSDEKDDNENKGTSEDRLQANKNRKSNTLVIIIVVFVVICSILLILGYIYYRKIYSKRKNTDPLSQERSASSYENRMSTSSNTSDSIHSENNRSSLVAHEFHNEKRNNARQGTKNWFREDV